MWNLKVDEELIESHTSRMREGAMIIDPSEYVATTI